MNLPRQGLFSLLGSQDLKEIQYASKDADKGLTYFQTNLADLKLWLCLKLIMRKCFLEELHRHTGQINGVCVMDWE